MRNLIIAVFLLVFTGRSVIFGQSDICKNAYLWEFTDEKGERDKLTQRTTDECEAVLSELECTLLQRRNFPKLWEQIENEKSVQSLQNSSEKVIAELEAGVKADIVVFGKVSQDIQGNLILSVSFEKLSSKEILKSGIIVLIGEESHNVIQRLKALKREMTALLFPEKKRERADMAEENEWDVAQTENTAQGYKVYLDKYPDGKYVGKARSRLRQLRDEKVTFSLSAYTETESTRERIAPEKPLYATNETEDDIRIEPALEYLKTFEGEGPISPLDFSIFPFDREWDFPSLDIKIVNNSDKTLFINQAIFQVSESEPDPRTLLILEPDKFRNNAMHINIINEGWGPAMNAVATFTLRPEQRLSDPSASDTVVHTLQLGDINEALNVNLSEAFKKIGVHTDVVSTLNYDGLQERYPHDNDDVVYKVNGDRKKSTFGEFREKYLGPFGQDAVLVEGTISFTQQIPGGGTENRKVDFSTTVYLWNLHMAGMPLPPSYEYGVRLRTSGKNYEERVSLSQVIKPGEADRFTIKIGLDQSSLHRFDLKLSYNNGQILEFKPVYLRAFVPISASRVVAPRAEQVLIRPRPSSVINYTVKQGDTLKSIAEQFGITVRDIVKLNDFPPRYQVLPGEQLLVPQFK